MEDGSRRSSDTHAFGKIELGPDCFRAISRKLGLSRKREVSPLEKSQTLESKFDSSRLAADS
jgi:hypothetical protein